MALTIILGLQYWPLGLVWYRLLHQKNNWTKDSRAWTIAWRHQEQVKNNLCWTLVRRNDPPYVPDLKRSEIRAIRASPSDFNVAGRISHQGTSHSILGRYWSFLRLWASAGNWPFFCPLITCWLCNEAEDRTGLYAGKPRPLLLHLKFSCGWSIIRLNFPAVSTCDKVSLTIRIFNGDSLAYFLAL
jgi:hypothetical protein